MALYKKAPDAEVFVNQKTRGKAVIRDRKTKAMKEVISKN
jgi:hypothetical protein